MNMVPIKGLLIAISVSLVTQTAIAEVYRCDENGKTVYSGTPCSNSAKKVDIQPAPISGRWANYKERRRLFLVKNPDIKPVYKQAIEAGVVIPGMTEEQALASLGPPAKRNLTQTTHGSSWQWVYEKYMGRGDYRRDYVYIQDGIVVGTN
jgi:hypothetical protein